MKIEKSKQLYEKAVNLMPGGVNSPVRAFLNVGGTPRFIKSAKKEYIYDEDGNKYLDYIGSWGPMILGHNPQFVVDAVQSALKNGMSFGAATKGEVEIADIICQNIPWVEKIRLVNSGTEAVMSAIRAARGYTGRNKIIKFAGCYHGHSDGLLVKAGSGAMTTGVPDSAGVPPEYTKNTLIAEYNNFDSVNNLFLKNPHSIACVIVEPVAANMGVVVPKSGFLENLRRLCSNSGAVLIFDEVITGFRLSFGGAAEKFGIIPDMVTYGKIIGGGMPVGAYGGRKEIMDMVSPQGPVYQAGTLSGNPIAVAAGYAQLDYLLKNPEIYSELETKGDYFRHGLDSLIKEYDINACVNGISSLSCLYFGKQKVLNYADALECDTKAFAKWFNFMIDKGYYFGPSQYESMFISDAHTFDDLNDTLRTASEFFKSIK